MWKGVYTFCTSFLNQGCGAEEIIFQLHKQTRSDTPLYKITFNNLRVSIS